MQSASTAERCRESRQVVSRPAKLSCVRSFARPITSRPLAIDRGHAVLGPRHVPGPFCAVAHAPGPSLTTRTVIATTPTPLNLDAHQRTRFVSRPLDRFDPKALDSESVYTRAAIPGALPCVLQRGEDTIASFDGEWDRF